MPHACFSLLRPESACLCECLHNRIGRSSCVFKAPIERQLSQSVSLIDAYLQNSRPAQIKKWPDRVRMDETQQVIPTIFYATLADLRRRLVPEAQDFRDLVTARPRTPLKALREHGRALVSRQILALSEYELIATLAFNEIRGEFHSLPSSVQRKSTQTWAVLRKTLDALQPRLLRLERGHPATRHERLAHWRSTCGSFNLGRKLFKTLRACGKSLINCYLAIASHSVHVPTQGEDEYIGLRGMQM